MICDLCDYQILDIINIPCIPEYLEHSCKLPHVFHDSCYKKILIEFGDNGYMYTYCPLPIKHKFIKESDDIR